MGDPKNGHRVALFILEASQAYCGFCQRYLTYYDSEKDNMALAQINLDSHVREQHKEGKSNG